MTHRWWLYSSLDGIPVRPTATPSNVSPVSIHTPGSREAIRWDLFCLRKLHDISHSAMVAKNRTHLEPIWILNPVDTGSEIFNSWYFQCCILPGCGRTGQIWDSEMSDWEVFSCWGCRWQGHDSTCAYDHQDAKRGEILASFFFFVLPNFSNIF